MVVSRTNPGGRHWLKVASTMPIAKKNIFTIYLFYRHNQNQKLMDRYLPFKIYNFYAPYSDIQL